ncbi:MAG TPA: TIGR01440 family protein [Soehngenia sp.]|nr:TIGR01440 family protein [Soehngenia sp.]
MDLIKIKEDVRTVTRQLLDAAKLNEKEAVIIGGSTSEIIGEKLGSNSNIDIARAVISTFVEEVKKENLYPVVQGCEHINRALVVEEEYAKMMNLEIVNVIPVLHAGGGFATAAMEIFEKPVVVESVKVSAGIDIGDVFIGMHLKPVGVVVRSEIKEIGKAHLSMIRTRPKLIGGERAVHQKL